MSCSLSHSINSVGGGVGGLRKEEVSPSAPPDLIEPNWMERFWCPAKSSALPPCTVTLFRGNQRTLLLHLVIRRRRLLGGCCTETVLIAFHYLNWELMPGFEKFIPISVYYTLLTIFMDYIILHACRDQLRGISGFIDTWELSTLEATHMLFMFLLITKTNRYWQQWKVVWICLIHTNIPLFHPINTKVQSSF